MQASPSAECLQWVESRHSADGALGIFLPGCSEPAEDEATDASRYRPDQWLMVHRHRDGGAGCDDEGVEGPVIDRDPSHLASMLCA